MLTNLYSQVFGHQLRRIQNEEEKKKKLKMLFTKENNTWTAVKH